MRIFFSVLKLDMNLSSCEFNKGKFDDNDEVPKLLETTGCKTSKIMNILSFMCVLFYVFLSVKPNQIVKLHDRFTTLDKESKGFLR